MKQKIFLSIMLVMLSSTSLFAHDFEVDGIYYTINGNEATVTFKGGGYNSFNNEYSGNVNIPETVNYNGIDYPVTSIGNWAFASCDALTAVNIPNSVRSINERAFSGCTGLSSIIFPSSLDNIGSFAFCGCDGLTNIDFPNSVTQIKTGAFDMCRGLTSIRIPSSVTYLGSNPFRNCKNITNITVDEGNHNYNSRNNCNAIIETVTNSLISGCQNTFIPNSVNKINPYAFEGCSQMTSIVIPNSVTSIGYAAFEGCSSLTNIDIPDSVTYLDQWVFSYCHALTDIVIPNSITSIGTCAFYDCDGLTNITFGNSVKEIGAQAFAWCSALTSVNIPNSVTTICEGAFTNCSSMRSVTLGNSVSSIDSHAFVEDLTLVKCFAVTPPSITNQTFMCESNATLEVPEESIEAYQTNDKWGRFHIIRPLGSDFCIDGIYYRTEGNTVTVTSVSYNHYMWSEMITIPDEITWGGKTYRVTAIGDGAFSSFSDSYFFRCIVIPEHVTSIGQNAFTGCEYLSYIVCYADTPPSIDSTTFSNYDEATLYVRYDCESYPNPYESYYNDEYWSQFQNIQPLYSDFCLNNVFYKINNNSTVSVSSCPYPWGYIGNMVIPENITRNGSNYTVTGISENAFDQCGDLTGLEIPNSVTYIGGWAFHGCERLETINIPNSVTEIGFGAFNGCQELGTINIPNLVTYIGERTFTGCSSLTSVNIPNSVTSIGDMAFSDCYSLTNIEIPNSVTSIGDQAFSSCYGLTSIIVDGGNTVYDSRDNSNAIIETATNTLMAGCQNTYIPNTVTSIGSYAFYGCSGLTSIEIPNSVTSIGYMAFTSCSGLTSIEIPNSVTSIPEYMLYCCTRLTSIEIPNSVTYIGYRAFESCSNLSSVVIPNSVTQISQRVFYGCRNLTSVNIPTSITSIDYQTFANCSSLSSIEIPKSVTLIQSNAFSGCSALNLVKCRAVNPPTIKSASFDCYNRATLEVPAISIDDYRNNQNWGRFMNIQAITPDAGDINGDGNISIGDVTNLIDLIIQGGDMPAYADVDGNGRVSIGDIATLIDMLLNSQ